MPNFKSMSYLHLSSSYLSPLLSLSLLPLSLSPISLSHPFGLIFYFTLLLSLNPSLSLSQSSQESKGALPVLSPLSSFLLSLPHPSLFLSFFLPPSLSLFLSHQPSVLQPSVRSVTRLASRSSTITQILKNPSLAQHTKGFLPVSPRINPSLAQRTVALSKNHHQAIFLLMHL